MSICFERTTDLPPGQVVALSAYPRGFLHNLIFVLLRVDGMILEPTGDDGRAITVRSLATVITHEKARNVTAEWICGRLSILVGNEVTCKANTYPMTW